jgi:hypothetical protein
MKEYRGIRIGDGATVTVNSQPLNPRHDLRNHSPNGFEWGYSGSGPAQLALAILADHLGDDERAQAVYQDFKFAVVAGLSGDEWMMNSQQIDEALKRISTPGVTSSIRLRRAPRF